MDSNLPPENTPPISPSGPPPIYQRPPSPPPLMGPAAFPRAARRSRGWKVFAIILLILLVISVVSNLNHLVRGSRSVAVGGSRHFRANSSASDVPMEEVTVRESTSPNKIVVIPVEGIISGEPIDQGHSMVTVIRHQLKLAREDHDVKAVILKVNSPGGEVLASDEIAKAIRDFQQETKRPVVVSMGSLAASGGYYISAPCQWIVANKLTITGSIGVIMHGYNYRALLDKIGVRPEVFKSGKYKDMLSGTKSPEEITPEERQLVQDLINETYGEFTNVVANGRAAAVKKSGGQPLSTNWLSFADGRILSGRQAYQLGFVDQIGDFDDALSQAKFLVHIQDAEVVEYKQVFAFANFLRMFGQSNAKSVKLDMGVDLPKLHAGYEYFLMPGYLQ